MNVLYYSLLRLASPRQTARVNCPRWGVLARKCLRTRLLHLDEKPAPRAIAPKPVAGLSPNFMDDKGRSHQQSQDSFLRGIEFRADAGSFAQITDIFEAVVAGKVREIAIAREVGDSVLCRSLPGLGSPVSGSLAGDGDNSLKWIARAKCAQ